MKRIILIYLTITLAGGILIGCAAGADRVRIEATATPVPAEPATTPVETTPLAPASQSPQVALRLVAGYLDQPTFVTPAGDGSGRLFIGERRGRIRVFKQGRLQADPFLDLASVVNADNDLEQGLLGLAFHPNFPDDPRFFVHYTDREDDVVLASYEAVADLSRGDESTAKTLLVIEQPFTNHNGGQLAFGPDGYLYVGVGEGGLNKDPGPGSLLGKILRLDVDSDSPYAIPAGNPFVDEPGYRPEIWALGFRNPWRFAFDPATSDLYIADVGQNQHEEINVEPAGSSGGGDYGWPVMEARHCYQADTCDPAGFVLPVVEYQHAQGCAVVGGHVYRGRQFSMLEGLYIYGDYCSGKMWAMRLGEAPVEVANTILNISSFGQDETGELYVLDLGQGHLYQVVVPNPETQTDWPGAWPLATEPEVTVNTEFAESIRLVGYTTDQPLASPGAVVGLTLFWQGQRIPETANVFVQVRDQANNTVAQADHPLYVSAQMLTADGATLRDGASLALPPDLPPGSYTVLVGFYNPENGERLPVLNDQTGENAAILAEFRIAE